MTTFLFHCSFKLFLSTEMFCSVWRQVTSSREMFNVLLPIQLDPMTRPVASKVVGAIYADYHGPTLTHFRILSEAIESM